MGKLLVLYDSQTGNTKKMAEHLVQGTEEVAGTGVRLRSVEEATVEDILWCDGMAVGSPTYPGLCPGG